LIPPLHVITDDGVLERQGFVDVAAVLLERAEARMALHLRGPATSSRRLHRIALDLRARAPKAIIVVNDRVDVALTADVSGVHLGQRSMSVPDARTLMGPEALVGASVHDRDEAMDPRVANADFYIAGNVFETLSHPGRSGAGPQLIGSIRNVVRAPVFAIGGISPDRVEVLVDAGAAGIAVLGGIWRSGDPRGAVDAYLQALGAVHVRDVPYEDSDEPPTDIEDE
jgi:thiazole tautomerase (transcriptional regulator TenI)